LLKTLTSEKIVMAASMNRMPASVDDLAGVPVSDLKENGIGNGG